MEYGWVLGKLDPDKMKQIHLNYTTRAQFYLFAMKYKTTAFYEKK
jgi:hypothetical protein